MPLHRQEISRGYQVSWDATPAVTPADGGVSGHFLRI